MKAELTSNSESIVYKIEARAERSPVAICDGILTDKWRTVSFRDYVYTSEKIAKHCMPLCDLTEISGLFEFLPYEAALSLAWMLIAQNRIGTIECRLVQYKLKRSHEVFKLGVVEMPEIKMDYKTVTITPISDSPTPSE